MNPVAHDWAHRNCARIEPEGERETSDEETGKTDEKGDVFSLVSFDKGIPEATVEHVSEARKRAPSEDAGNETESVEAVVDRKITPDSSVLDGGEDSEGQGQEERD